MQASKPAKKFVSFVHEGNLYLANERTKIEADRLPAGVYLIKVTPQGQMYFEQVETNHDELIDLPTKEFDQVVGQIEKFMRPETKTAFKKYGFLYKRSALIYGPWGTGKTCLVNRVANFVMERSGVVLFNPNPKLLTLALDQINQIQPDSMVLVIFEELDKLMQNFEGELLNILDGEVQKENIIYLATTNFIEKIPPRICRPGRFSSLVEVGYPTTEVRAFYLKLKLKDEVDINEWVEKTHGFSIDELTETVRQVACLGENLDLTIARIRKVKDSKSVDPRQSGEDDGEEEFEY